MADISSITLPEGGTYDLKDKNAVPKYGMGKNLLDNAYFVGGGSQLGDGVFPINQRGQSSYNTNGSYTIDRWWLNSWRAQNIDVTIDAAGITLSQTGTGPNSLYLAQKISRWQQYAGKTVTVSILVTSLSGGSCAFLFGAVDGTRYRSSILGIGLNTFTVTLPNDITGLHVAFGHHASLGGSGAVTLTVSAAKLELGTEQTLAHQENGVWVLNEIPDYEEELIKCQTSTADSTDTYANKSLATEQQLAYVETGTTASRNYSAGKYICWNGLTYTADTNIALGATLSASGGNKNLTECVGGGLNSNSIHRAAIPLYNAQTLFTLERGFGIAKVYGGNNGTTAVLTRTEQGSTRTRTVSVGASSWENIPVVAGDTITYYGGPYSNAEIYYISHHIGP